MSQNVHCLFLPFFMRVSNPLTKVFETVEILNLRSGRFLEKDVIDKSPL